MIFWALIEPFLVEKIEMNNMVVLIYGGFWENVSPYIYLIGSIKGSRAG